MIDPLHRHAQAQPDALALWSPGWQWTYADLDASVAATRARLCEAGMEEGQRVVLHLDRRPSTVVLLWALWRQGAVAVPLSTRLPAGEVPNYTKRVGADVLVTDDPAVAEAVGANVSVWSPPDVVQNIGNPGARPSSAIEWTGDRPATIIFTSGSTGTPKAALHTWANHLYSAKGSNANLPLGQGDRWLLSLPLYHVGGLAILVRCALAGAAVAVPDPEASVAEQVTISRPTHVSLVATQFRRLFDDTPESPPADLRAVLLGGGPIPDALLRRGHERGWPLHTSYGSTEMASQVTTTAPGAPLGDLRTAGRRLPHRRLRIEEGEIQVAGAPLFRGYVTPDGIDDPRTDDGWYPTGDRGRLDASGRLYVLGRLDRMFVSGGENVQPEEIEAALERLDGIERAVVVPVADTEYGARPVAFLQASDSWDVSALEGALASELPGFKIPDAFHSLPDEARTGSVKIDREWLREQARKLQDNTVPNENSR